MKKFAALAAALMVVVLPGCDRRPAGTAEDVLHAWRAYRENYDRVVFSNAVRRAGQEPEVLNALISATTDEPTRLQGAVDRALVLYLTQTADSLTEAVLISGSYEKTRRSEWLQVSTDGLSIADFEPNLTEEDLHARGRLLMKCSETEQFERMETLAISLYATGWTESFAEACLVAECYAIHLRRADGEFGGYPPKPMPTPGE